MFLCRLCAGTKVLETAEHDATAADVILAINFVGNAVLDQLKLIRGSIHHKKKKVERE